MSSEQLEAERKAFEAMMANEFGIVDVEDMLRNGSSRDQMRIMIAKKAWQAARSQPAAPRVVSDEDLERAYARQEKALLAGCSTRKALRRALETDRAALQSIAPAQQAYLVGQIRAIADPIEGYELHQPQIWEFSGVHLSVEAAEAACRDWTYFVGGPFKIGDSAPHETDQEYMRQWFPIARTHESGFLPGECAKQHAQPSVPVVLKCDAWSCDGGRVVGPYETSMICGKCNGTGYLGDPVDAFLSEVRAEILRARTKFPGDRLMTVALAEEFGELCKAVLDEPRANVRKEAVQTACMCARVVLDGDGSVDDWRASKGLDKLIAAHDGKGK